MHTRHDLCHFVRYVAKSKLFCRKRCSYGEIFVPVGEISDLGNRAGPVFHMNISKFLQRKYEYSEISVAELARPTGLIIVYNSLPNWYFLI